MNILITGATGLIGRNIAEYFASNTDHNILCTYHKTQPFYHPNLNWIQTDLTKADNVQSIVSNQDVIIHAAATTSGSKDIINTPYYHVTDNVIMGSLLFKESYLQDVKTVIFFSCSVMYQSSDKPAKESDFNPNYEMAKSYFGVGWTKVYLEKMCQFYSSLGKTKFCAIRHSNIYGPYDKYDLEKSHVFGATITKVLTNTNGFIEVWGDGSTGRDFLHVDDLVDLVYSVAHELTDQFELINAGSGHIVTVKDLVTKIIQISRLPLEIKFDETKPCIKTGLCLDYSAANKKYNWKPSISLDEGIKRTIEWYKTNVK